MAKIALFPSHYDGKKIFHFPDYWDSNLTEWVTLWIQDLQAGVQPVTPETVRTFRDRFIRYTRYIHEELHKSPVTLDACLDMKSLYSRISSFPVESYSNRHNTYFAVRSFARFLIKLEQLDESYLAKIKPLKPKRVVPAKKTVLRDKDTVEQFREAIQRDSYESDWSYLTVKTITEALIQTGLRSAELAGLRIQDMDLTHSRLTVYLGKGRKSRVIGISQGLTPILTSYLLERQKQPIPTDPESPFFLNGKGLPLRSINIARMVHKISKLMNVPITAHGLRRTFATLHAENGRPLHLIQRALGHADITTTQGYLMSDQEAVVEAMQGW